MEPTGRQADSAALSTPRPGYPLTFRVDYPDRPLNRLTTFFRFLWIIPIGVIAGPPDLGQHHRCTAPNTRGRGPWVGSSSFPSC